MNNSIAINSELQIDNVLFGITENETIAVNEKTK